MNETLQFKPAMLACIATLQSYAISLCGNRALAEDLVQETLMKGWAKRHTLAEDSDIRAWLLAILRNQYYSHARRAWREVADEEGRMAMKLISLPNQEAHIALGDVRTAVYRMPRCWRDALMLVGAEGLSYEEAAKACGTPVGTIKSRVSRARRCLVDHDDEVLKDRH